MQIIDTLVQWLSQKCCKLKKENIAVIFEFLFQIEWEYLLLWGECSNN